MSPEDVALALGRAAFAAGVELARGERGEDVLLAAARSLLEQAEAGVRARERERFPELREVAP